MISVKFQSLLKLTLTLCIHLNYQSVLPTSASVVIHSSCQWQWQEFLTHWSNDKPADLHVSDVLLASVLSSSSGPVCPKPNNKHKQPLITINKLLLCTAAFIPSSIVRQPYSWLNTVQESIYSFTRLKVSKPGH